MSDVATNRFQKKDAFRRAARAASDTQGQRQERREADHVKWVHQAGKKVGGVPTKPELAALRALALADAKNPDGARLDHIKTLVMEYLTKTPAGQQLLAQDRVIEANVQTLCNGILYAESQGYPLTFETVTTVHLAAARDHNIFLNRHVGSNGSLILQPGEVAPTVFEWRTPREAVTANNEVFDAEVTELKKLSDAELRQRALADRKYPNQGHPGHGGGL